jgi:hypothetical protein
MQELPVREDSILSSSIMSMKSGLSGSMDFTASKCEFVGQTITGHHHG